MTSSYRTSIQDDGQERLYRDVEGGETTLLMGFTTENGDGNGIAAPPDKLSEFQIKA